MENERLKLVVNKEEKMETVKSIAVIIRVYDRIEDLSNNLKIIIDTWIRYDYYIIVVSNGYNSGHIVDKADHQYIDKLVVLEQNSGHKKGNSQLLMEGMKYIPDNCDYTIILEADTWLYEDRIILEYVKEMKKLTNVVWASADWYDKQYGLAMDFAIIKSKFIKENPSLFDFELFPECYISNFLRDKGVSYMWIEENMPVHIPSYVPRYPYVNNSKEKRFYVFPESKMVTHHIEYLKGGLPQKKYYFNVVCGRNYFADMPVRSRKFQLFKMRFWIDLSKYFIKKSWFSKKKYMEIP